MIKYNKMNLYIGAGILHLDAAGIHIQVQKKTVNMHGVVAGICVAIAVVLSLTGVLCVNISFYYVNNVMYVHQRIVESSDMFKYCMARLKIYQYSNTNIK